MELAVGCVQLLEIHQEGKKRKYEKPYFEKNVNKYKSMENNMLNNNVSITQPKNDQIIAGCISSLPPFSEIILEYPRYNITSLVINISA